MGANDEHASRPRHVLIAVLAVIVTAASGAYAWQLISAPAPPVSAPALPAPTTIAPPGSLSPTVDRPALPGVTLGPLDLVVPDADSIERSVEKSLAPWQSQAINVITGWPLESADFTMDVTLINGVVAAVPPPWSFARLDSDTVPTPAGQIDVEWAESTQPFRARLLLGTDGTLLARVWVFAGASEPGVQYVRTARDRWNPGTAADHLSVSGAIIVTAVIPPADDSTGGTWFTSLSRNVAVLVEATPDLTQQDVVGFLLQWRLSFGGS